MDNYKKDSLDLRHNAAYNFNIVNKDMVQLLAVNDSVWLYVKILHMHIAC